MSSQDLHQDFHNKVCSDLSSPCVIAIAIATTHTHRPAYSELYTQFITVVAAV